MQMVLEILLWCSNWFSWVFWQFSSNLSRHNHTLSSTSQSDDFFNSVLYGQVMELQLMRITGVGFQDRFGLDKTKK